MIGLRVVGADLVSKVFGAAAATVDQRVENRLDHWGQLLQTAVKARASGRPGPRAQTGDYRRSITRQRGTHRGMKAVIVGTNRPQGRRLEYGFVGVDSLGRHYDQPPYPHFRPATKQIELPMVRDIGRTAVLPLLGRGGR